MQGKKRLFIGLITGTSVLLCVLLLVGWIIPYIGFGNIHPSVPYVTGALLALLILAIAWASLGLVLHIAFGRAFWGEGKARGLTIKLFLPLMEFLARLVGVAPLEVRQSFIRVNNELNLDKAGRYKPEELLILLPHCVQNSECAVRVNHNADLCKRCGKCPLAALLELRDRYGVRLAIATGGTIARRIVVEARPRLIIAVACERDLSSGIQDSYPLPVYGILNERPHGPCRDTLVPLDRLENALCFFINPELLPAASTRPELHRYEDVK